MWLSHASQPINSVGVTVGHASFDAGGFPSGRHQLQLVSCQSRPRRTGGLGVMTHREPKHFRVRYAEELDWFTVLGGDNLAV